MFRFLVLVALAIISTVDSSAVLSNRIYPHERIVGGNDADIKDHPYQISLQVDGSHSCGGSIISKHYVVTAGHCVGSPAERLTIKSGSSHRISGGSIRQVDKVIRHERYSTNGYGVPVNDVAVLRVSEPFVFDETCQPIELFGADEESKPGVEAVISGWGSTGSLGLPDQLQNVTIPIISKKLCGKAYQPYGGLPAGQICAAYYGQGGKDSCQGDSGGPLTIGGRLAGIVSWGNGCAQPNYPGVYTEVATFKDWIDEKTQS